MAGRLRYSQIQINNGEVLQQSHTDWLETVTWDQMVDTIQKNVRRSYWEVQDMANGVVHIDKSGVVTVWTVQIEP
jgi:hypothetical protein